MPDAIERIANGDFHRGDRWARVFLIIAILSLTISVLLAVLLLATR